MLLLACSLLVLVVQDLLDDLLSGLLFGQGLVILGWCCGPGFKAGLGTCSLEMFFYHLHREALVHSEAAVGTLIATSVR